MAGIMLTSRWCRTGLANCSCHAALSSQVRAVVPATRTQQVPKVAPALQILIVFSCRRPRVTISSIIPTHCMGLVECALTQDKSNTTPSTHGEGAVALPLPRVQAKAKVWGFLKDQKGLLHDLPSSPDPPRKLVHWISKT